MKKALASFTIDLMREPLVIDLYAGLGGWAEGFLSEGYRVVGFDTERHDYGTGGYPGQLVLQDVLTLHGRQFRDAAVIVASPPCQAYSCRAMPWCRLIDAIGFDLARMDDDGAPPDGPTCNPLVYNDLFNACFRIQREASETSGRIIPMVVENVFGAERWVGPAKWRYGSYFLWGDVPALMPPAKAPKVPGFRFDGSGKSFQTASVENGRKVPGIKLSQVGFNVAAAQNYRKTRCHDLHIKRDSRKAASAQIAKIPFPLAQWIAQVYKPEPSKTRIFG